MVTMPEYVVEPPDILRIRAIRVIPKKPYHVGPLDSILIQVTDVPDADRVGGVFVVEPDGNINIGPRHGGPLNIVEQTDGTIPSIAAAVQKHLREKAKFPDARVTVSLAQSRAFDMVQGDHLVQPDGTVNLGAYGLVRVVGMTLTQARAAVEAHLSAWLQNPEVAINVSSFNSKVYYVVFDGAGRGQQVVIQPITGNDTVLRALSQVGGLTPVSSTDRLWIARPAPASSEVELIMPVDWIGIVTKGRTRTNYQLMPGDRLFVKANPLIATDNYLAQLLSPIERIFGVTLLGNSTIRAVAGQNGGSGGSVP
jgi:polysaccharide export outer membrane protein